MNLIDVIDEALKNNQNFPNESHAEYIHRCIRPYIVTKEEFDSLSQEVDSLDRGTYIPDDPVDPDEVAIIAKNVVEEEVHTEEIKKMYGEIKKMHQELIDKQGVL